MEYQQGQHRNQLALYTTCLDDMVPEDNSVRLIDQFVGGLDMQALGFKTMSCQGRPPYHPADLLKLYIYGYMNPPGRTACAPPANWKKSATAT